MDDQNRNLILASVLSFLVIVAWFFFFPPPEPVQTSAVEATDASTNQQTSALPGVEKSASSATGQTVSTAEDAPRISIETQKLMGTISLKGGRIDDLSLLGYKVDLSEGAENVTLLKPVGEEGAYYATYGWAALSGVTSNLVPTPDTLWEVNGNNRLTVSSPVELVWDNGAGLKFSRVISIDEDYLFTVKQNVENTSATDVELRPYGLIRRAGEPKDVKNFFILHEGLVRMSDGELAEDSYKNMRGYDSNEREGTAAKRIEVTTNGWVGFTDHFWMTTLIPTPGSAFRSTAKYYEQADIYQAETVLPVVSLSSGQSASVETQFFAGAKEWETIRNYENAGVEGFIDSIDWGWFFFLTKPIFIVLHWLNQVIGNMGWSIIGLTLLIKALLFPLAYKSYVSMAKMKELQPQMEKLKEQAGDDRQKLQQGMMELYKKEKVNPASGCLPILLQIPIFFSLYKVIFVTLELRHAPWIGWIKDLSAPDPSSIMNLFGLLPFGTPEPGSIMALIFLGILPLILGISMWLQQKLNPAPTDPTQAMIFAWMPWVFMFMLGSFASGLLVYWIANNMITFTQQYIIMRSQGYKPDVFGNILKGFQKKSKG
ncbi:MAG: membrane protein insertase YidC [Rhodobacteraceae bacterium]|jgi:YidC/Oxa1 family membrane protein insertase|nr:membrane protein insertase YidC [Paracoccaceae bacterium]